MKAFTDDTINVTEKHNFFLEWVENIVEKGENAGYQHFLFLVGKGENAGYQHFSFSPYVFEKLLFQGH